MSIKSLFYRIKGHLYWRLHGLDFYLSKVRGVIHVGANEGQERDKYARRRLRVLWIEPIPEIYEKLRKNIEGYSGQTCLNNLVTDVDDKEYIFHVSNNSGISSSILDIAGHRSLFPAVDYSSHLHLRSVTLKTLLSRSKVDVSFYNALILDTQGSELLVLKGAGGDLLRRFKFIQTEVADFESYEGGCKLNEMDAYMNDHGFHSWRKNCFKKGEVGSYYDIVYARS